MRAACSEYFFSNSKKLMIRQSTKWSICSGESVFHQNFISLSAKRKNLFILMVGMSDNHAYLRQLEISSIKENKIFEYYQNIWLDSKMFISMFIRTFFPEIYVTTEKRGFNLKSYFHILLKAYRDNMQ